ncbi:MAG: GNAT family N-acetyltransferase [Gammaproteobacteria bacterium]
MQATIIDNLAQFDALAQPWQELAHAADSRPFHEFGWVSSCLHFLGRQDDRQLRLAVLWAGERLRAVLPLTVRRHNGVRVLEWIGVQATDYCDALLDPRIDRSAALRALWDALQRRGGFDVVRLGHVRGDAQINVLLEPLHPWIETLEEAQYLPLRWASGSDWLAEQSARMRERVNYGLRRIGKMGYEFHVWEPQEPTTSVVEAALGQKRAWLETRKLNSFLLDPEGPEFIHACVAAMAASGSLHLSAIRSQDRMIACHLGFLRNGILYYYMPTYDAAWSKYGVGTMLRDSLIMWACDRGLRQFDMLLGAHDYKAQYGVAAEPLRTLALARGPMGRLALSAYKFLVARARKAAGHAANPA